MEGSGVYINKIPGFRGADGRQVSCGDTMVCKTPSVIFIFYWSKIKDKVREENFIRSFYDMYHIDFVSNYMFVCLFVGLKGPPGLPGLPVSNAD